MSTDREDLQRRLRRKNGRRMRQRASRQTNLPLQRQASSLKSSIQALVELCLLVLSLKFTIQVGFRMVPCLTPR